LIENQSMKLTILGLRAALVCLGLAALAVQILLPNGSGEVVADLPEVAHLRWPYVVAAILAIVCFQVVLVMMWRLVGLVARGEIFNRGSLPLVNTIIAACGVAAVLCLGVIADMLWIENIGGPPMVLALNGAFGICVTGALLMIVMRGLLVTAIANHDELTEVI